MRASAFYQSPRPRRLAHLSAEQAPRRRPVGWFRVAAVAGRRPIQAVQHLQEALGVRKPVQPVSGCEARGGGCVEQGSGGGGGRRRRRERERRSWPPARACVCPIASGPLDLERHGGPGRAGAAHKRGCCEGAPGLSGMLFGCGESDQKPISTSSSNVGAAGRRAGNARRVHAPSCPNCTPILLHATCKLPGQRLIARRRAAAV